MVGRKVNKTVLKTRRGDSRAAIVDAGERLFLEHGFVTVTIAEVAEAIVNNTTTILVVISAQAIVTADAVKKTLTRLMILTDQHRHKLKMLIWQISS